jgi:hypothetical protein
MLVTTAPYVDTNAHKSNPPTAHHVSTLSSQVRLKRSRNTTKLLAATHTHTPSFLQCSPLHSLHSPLRKRTRTLPTANMSSYLPSIPYPIAIHLEICSITTSHFVSSRTSSPNTLHKQLLVYTHKKQPLPMHAPINILKHAYHSPTKISRKYSSGKFPLQHPTHSSPRSSGHIG